MIDYSDSDYIRMYPILQYFKDDTFRKFAFEIVRKHDAIGFRSEIGIGLRKLLEAKDCFTR